MIEPRRVLDQLIKDREETYASVSRLLGRNPAYIQQYIQRGSPKRLEDDDIAQLARHFDVPEVTFGGPPALPLDHCSTIELPVLNPPADLDPPRRSRAFDEALIRQLTRKPHGLAVVFVEGNGMCPTLRHGDELLVQRHADKTRLSDGLYAIRADANLLVRRIAIEPRRNVISVLSDNPYYPRWEGIARRSIQIVGRALWIGHQVR